MQASQNCHDFLFGKHGRQTRGNLGADPTTKFVERQTHHFAIQKNQCVERLILRGGRDVSINRQPGEELCDFCAAHFPWVPQFVEADVPLHPVNVSTFGSNAVVTNANRVAQFSE